MIFFSRQISDALPKSFSLSQVADSFKRTSQAVTARLVSAMLVYGAIHMMKVTKGVYASTFNMSFSYLYLIQISGIVLFSLLVLRDMFSTFSAKVQESESTSGSQEQ